MVQTASSNETTVAAVTDAVERDAALNGAAPNGALGGLPILTTEDGTRVVDLREPPAADGVFVIVDGELVLRLADGTEYPLTGPAVAEDAGAGLVLQLGDALFFPAEVVKAAVADAELPPPLASLADAGSPDDLEAADALAAVEPAAGEPAAGEGEGPVRGGAPFRAFTIEAIGETLAPTMQLGAVAGGGESGSSGPTSRLGEGMGGSSFVNLRPEAVDDLIDGDEETPVTFDPIANDSDPNQGEAVRIVSVDTTGLVGELTQLADGSFVYDSKGRFQHLGEGESAEESFTYTIADPHGAKSTAEVTLTIHGVNDAPVAVDDHVRTNEDAAKVHIFAIDNDSDVDINDTIRVVSVDSTGLVGTVTLNDSGSLTYRSNGAFNYLGQGEKAFETFSYTIADQHGATSTATVTVRIDGRNDAPVAEDDYVVVSEKGEVRFNALANDSDPDVNDTIRVISLQSLGNSQGQRWINHDGTVTYRPHGAYDYLGEGEVAYQQFVYTIADQHGATSQATVTVKIVGVNDAPVANDDKGVTDEDNAVVMDLLANDTDVDVNDTHRIAAIDTTGLEGEVTLNADGTVTYDPNGQFEHLAVGETATETFRYMVADQHGATSTATAEVLIHGVNDAPVAQADSFVGFAGIGFYAPLAALIGNDTDIDGDPLQVLGIGNALGGNVTVTDDGFVVFTPAAGYTGDATFQYLVGDAHGGVALGDVLVDIRPITPGDIEFETLAFFAALTDATATENPDGSIQIDMVMDVQAVAGAAVTIGGMPFFTAIMSGELTGLMTVSVDGDGRPQATGDIVGDLAFDVYLSPIFQPLGGALYDDLLLAATGAPASHTTPTLPPMALDPLTELALGLLDEMQSQGGPVQAYAEAIAEASAFSFGDGTFYLDIAGLLGGAASVGEEGLPPDFVADLLAQFAAAAVIDIRDDVSIDADGVIDGNFHITTAPMPLAMNIGVNVTEPSGEELAMAA